MTVAAQENFRKKNGPRGEARIKMTPSENSRPWTVTTGGRMHIRKNGASTNAMLSPIVFATRFCSPEDDPVAAQQQQDRQNQ